MGDVESRQDRQLRPSSNLKGATLWVALCLAVVAVALAGCYGIRAVTLRNQETQQTVTCGPYRRAFGMGYQEMDRCLDDYQRQGFVRVPTPD